MKKQTISEFLSRLDSYRNPTTDSVIIHPGLNYNFIELKKDFIEQFKDEIRTKLMMVEHGIDELDAITKFTIMILENSY